MSGDANAKESADWQWAHILWQRHNLRMEDFAIMPREIQLAYIASEELELKTPVASLDKILKARIMASKKTKRKR